jgi:hypothetical protein
MKKLITTFSIYVLAIASMFAQAPEKFNYQGVARDNSGNVLPNQNIAIKLSIITGTPTGTVQYSERHVITTNSFGLFSVKIGEPTSVISGTFAAITWASGDKYVKVELDPTGGSSYTDMGTSQLVSVPYALTSGDNKWTATGNNISNNNSGNVGIGTSVPATQLHVKSAGNVGGTFSSVLFAQNNTGFQDGLRVQVKDNITDLGADYAGTNHDANLTFSTRASGAALTERMRINQNGSIGIGTTSPSERLQIYHNQNATSGIHISSLATGSTNTDGLFIGTDAGGTAIIDQRENSSLVFKTNGTAQMRINPSGNLGIGTTSPGAKLEVIGQVKITGGSPGLGKVLTSDATGLATWESPTQTGNYSEDQIIVPTTTNLSWAGPKVTLTTTAGQKVMIVATVAMGSTSVGGAQYLDLSAAYATTGSSVPTNGDLGLLNLRVQQNTRHVFTVTAIYSPGAGTWDFGPAIRLNTLTTNWNYNDYGQVSAIIF